MYLPSTRQEFAEILSALDTYASAEGLSAISEALQDAQIALAMSEGGQFRQAAVPVACHAGPGTPEQEQR